VCPVRTSWTTQQALRPSERLQCLSAVCPVRTASPKCGITKCATIVFNAFRLCVLCGPASQILSRIDKELIGLQCLSAVCPVRTEDVRKTLPSGEESLQCLSAVCPVRTHQSSSLFSFDWNCPSSMPFGCVSCADRGAPGLGQDDAGEVSSMPFGCVSCADLHAETASLIANLVFNAFRLCVLCGRGAETPRAFFIRATSSMPFGCVSCADRKEEGYSWGRSKSLQCLSAVCPVRTACGRDNVQRSRPRSSMPFGCVSCADAAIPGEARR